MHMRSPRLLGSALAAALALSALPATAQSQIPATERQYLLDLYASTNGPGWTNQTGWNGPAGTECSWYGVSCTYINDSPFVNGISLWNNRLTGTLPGALTRLPQLSSFDVSSNRLTGSIPKLTGLPFLSYFYVGSNRLTGTIPTLAGLSSLSYFSASDNRLSGPLPDVTGTSLYWIDVSSNQLSGGIPPSFTTLVESCISIDYNMISEPNQARVDFVNQHQCGGQVGARAPLVPSFPQDFRLTQTVAPTDLAVPVLSATDARVSWKRIPYMDDPGFYEVFTSTSPDGPFQPAGQTASKSDGSLLVAGLAPGTTYYFNVRTTTLAGPQNQSTLTSGPSATASFTTAGSGCPPPDAPVLSTATTAVNGGQSFLVTWTVPASVPAGSTFVVETSRGPDFSTLESTLETAAAAAVLTAPRADAPYDLYVRVRALSSCGSVGSDSAPLRFTVALAPTTFAFTRSSPAWIVAAGDAPPTAEVEVKNVGATAGSISFSARGGLFDVSPAALTLAPGAKGTVTLSVHADAVASPGVAEGLLVGTWGNESLSTQGALTVTSVPIPPGSHAGSKVHASATSILFLAPKGETPAPQTLTLTVPHVAGSGPLYLAPTIGPGGSWLVLSNELSQPLPESGQVTISLSVDRSRRATADGGPPLRALVTFAPVGGNPEDAAVVEVIDQESWTLSSGAGARSGLSIRSLASSAPVSGFLVPTTAKTEGGNGAVFSGDGWLRNLGATDAPVAAFFTPRDEDGLTGTGVLEAQSTIGPGQTVRLADLLGSVFQTTGSGQVELRSPAAAGLSLRTTVDSVTGGDPALGFGTEIPALASGAGAVKDGPPLVLPGISDDAANRCNLVLAETSGAAVGAKVDLYAPAGALLGSTTANVPPYGQVQINRIVQVIAPGQTVTGGWLEVSVTSGTGRLAAVATVLDNRSNSFSAVSGLPLPASAPAPAARVRPADASPLAFVVPTLVKATGANGTQYLTGLNVVNGLATPANLSLTYHYTDLTDGSSKVATGTLQLPGRRALDQALARDFITNVLGVTVPSRGWLEVTGDVANVTAVATISTLVDPSDPAKGLNSAQVSGFLTTSGAVMQLGTAETRFAGSEKSVVKRTNLILVETSGQPASVRLRAYSPTGQLLAEKLLDIPANAYYQVSDVFGDAGLGLGAGPFQNVEVAAQVVDGAGGVVGVVTVVGNLSRNPQIFVMQNAGPPPAIGF